jgi:hypothetical protein
MSVSNHAGARRSNMRAQPEDEKRELGDDAGEWNRPVSSNLRPEASRPSDGSLADVQRAFLARFVECALDHYGARLVSLVVFGSVGP